MISYGSYRPFVTRGILAITGEERERARARRKQGIKKGVAVLWRNFLCAFKMPRATRGGKDVRVLPELPFERQKFHSQFNFVARWETSFLWFSAILFKLLFFHGGEFIRLDVRTSGRFRLIIISYESGTNEEAFVLKDRHENCNKEMCEIFHFILLYELEEL